MPETLSILRQRRERRDQSRRSAESRTRRIIVGCGFIISILIAGSILTAAYAWAALTRDLPSIAAIPILLDPRNGALLQPTRLYDRTGAHTIAVLAPSDAPRRYIPLESFPQDLIHATISTQTDLAGQLASSLLLWNEAPSPQRDLRQRLLAAQLNSAYGQDRILEWTLNSADYGRFAYGADAAAQLYFGLPVEQLNSAQSALLAAVSRSPAINPFDAPQDALANQRQILDEMQAKGFLTAEQYGQALALPLGIQPAPAQLSLSPAFVDLVLAQLDSGFNRGRIARGGLNIVTTLDYDLQAQAACALQTQLSRLSGDDTLVTSAYGSACVAAQDLPALPSGASTTEAAASAAVIDPRTGQVLALVGETDLEGNQSGLTARRIGSLVTPFIYLTGFARGMSPASLGWDIPAGISGASGDVHNPDGRFHGPVRLREALASDYLVPAAEILVQLGAESVARIAAPFGISFPAGGGDPLLGNALLTPLDVARAYGVFGNQGVLAGWKSGEILRPAAVLNVESVDHAPWFSAATPDVQAVVSPQLSYLMTDVLRDPTARRGTTGGAALDINRPAGAKVGQTEDGRDLWAVGYTPDRSVAVWLGGETAQSPAPASGLWRALMNFASRDVSPEGWAQPQGMTAKDVCSPSGLLPTDACPLVVREVFLEGNQPVQYDDLYRSFPINRETKMLATIFTPPQLVENKVFMVVPEAAKEWAASVGLLTPPDTFDTIQAKPPTPDVNIASPEMFAEVNGRVEVSGTAAGEGFLFYRLQYGQGLNPQVWYQIGDDSTVPVSDGLLGEWDTSGLSGLYVLQLQVIRLDQSLETDTIFVTVKEP
jgi:membrane peptidoglycan carboxypeptidase